MKVAFAGTPEFAAGHLQALIASHHDVVAVITQPDRPGKRGKKLIPSPVKVVAEAAAIPCLQPTKLTTDNFDGLEFDLLVVVAYGQILRPPVLAWPKYGCINVHASLLPRWRGAAPVQRAILAGDQETGVTVIQMDEGLDTGAMLATRNITIETSETTASLLSKMLEAGGTCLIEVIDSIEAGSINPVAQEDSQSTYASKIEKPEALIDWQATAARVDRQVRAFQPDPVAFTYLGDKRVKIHAGEVAAGAGPAGEILSVTAKGVLVGCGESAYLIQAIQLPLGKGSILSPKDVMNGWMDVLSPGTRFEAAPASTGR